MSNGKTFLNRTTLNGDRVVHMNLNNGERTDADKGQLVGAVVNLDEYLVVDLELVTGMATVGLEEAFVNESLSVASQCVNVGNQGDVEEHVTLKHKCTWRVKSKRGARGTTMGIHRSSQSIVNQHVGFLGHFGGKKVYESTDNLTNTVANSFNDAVGGWSVRRNENLGNAHVIKIELKFVIFEFGATVVNNPDGPRVAGKPVILEKAFGVCAILRALEAHNFKKVGDGFNHGKCIKLELLTVDFHRPWPNVINSNFGPWCDGSISRGQLTMLRSGKTNLGTNWTSRHDFLNSGTNARVVKVMVYQLLEAIHTGGVDGVFMVLLDKWNQHGVGEADVPGWV